MRVVYSERHRLHQPEHDVQAGVPFPIVEQPERVERIRQSLESDGTFQIVPPDTFGLAPIQAVHAPGLVAFLRDSWQVWRSVNAAPEMFPDTVLHAALIDGMRSPPEPRDPVGRLGYWCFDTGTPVVSGTFEAALSAVDVALSTTRLVLDGARAAYGLCRPPGHHAARGAYGGFCYFNNAAIAADYAVRETGSKIAVLDLDYHHGNGTQQIFYQRADVLYLSLHADPLRAYPYFSGHADETGAGSGSGTTLNIPLPVGTSDTMYLSALDAALEALVHFAPALTVVSLGIDTYVDDPLGDFLLTTPVYAEAGRRVASATSALVILQEGGYYLPALGENVRQFLRGTRSS